jgi:hypothetical protein
VFWAYANRKTRSKEGVPNLSRSGDPKNKDLTQTAREKAEVLSEYFSSVFTEEKPGHWNLPPSTSPNIQDEVEFTVQEVEELLQDIDPEKSLGPDKIHPKVLKEARSQLARPLTLLFNKSFNEGEIPTDWRKANVTAIFKKGDKRVPGNYRPVSLTSVVCKLMEKLLRRKILNHLQTHSILSENQFGFIEGRSTLLQLLITVEKWTEALERGEEVDVVFLDFKKAFDKVSHKRLLDVTEFYGVKGKFSKWIKAFLSQRTQTVCLENETATPMDVESGVPQGSVLGPILFVIFVNTLPDVVKHSHVLMFADDTKVFKEIRNPRDQELLQSDINRMDNWTEDSLLEFNVTKCRSMTVSRHGRQEREYSLKNSRLEATETEKDLGVTVDPKLTFEGHMLEKVRKANTVMMVIRNTFTYLDKESFLLLYKALVRPHVEYCNQVWHPNLQKHIDMVENVQRRATKLVPGLRDMSYEERLKKLDLPSLAYRRLRGDMVEAFKIVNNKYNSQLAQEILTINTRGTRSNDRNVQVKFAHSNIRKKTFSNRIPKYWNKLPQHVVSAENVATFEARLDRHWNNLPLKFNYKSI